jgi:hypothetical protein
LVISAVMPCSLVDHYQCFGGNPTASIFTLFWYVNSLLDNPEDNNFILSILRTPNSTWANALPPTLPAPVPGINICNVKQLSWKSTSYIMA